MTGICQACQNALIEVINSDDDPEQPYEVCAACNHRLLAFSLRPREWYNLAVIHGYWKFLLHDDFYYYGGQATQPKEPVIDAEQHPSPTLEQVADIPDDLLNYALVYWYLREDSIVATMRKHGKDVWLQTLQARLEGTRNGGIIDTLFYFCGLLLGEHGAPLVCKGWEEHREVAFDGLSFALAKCVPLEEGFAKVIDALNQMRYQKRCTAMMNLGWFQTPLTLDWIEVNVRNFNDEWGKLASFSRFDWHRAKKWIDNGRLLSLVALDALTECVRYNTVMHQELKPRLINPPPRDELITTLDEYWKRDDVPRVERRVKFLIENVEILLHGQTDDLH